MPGEWYAPTQPFPLDARGNLFQYDLQRLLARRPDRLHARAARRRRRRSIARYKIGPIYTPPTVSRAEGPLGTLQLAINGGGTVWAGGSYDPETRILYVYSRRSPGVLGLIKPDPVEERHELHPGQRADRRARRGADGRGARDERRSRSRKARRRPRACAAQRRRTAASAGGTCRRTRRGRGGGGGEGGGGGLTVQGLPIVKPPYGSISAISLDKGEILWQIAHGDTPDNVRNHPGAERAQHSAHRPGRHHRHAGDQDAAHRRRGAGDERGGPSARRAAARVRQGDRQGCRLGAHAGAAERLADDLHARRQAVHRVAIGGGNYPGELLAFRLPG